MTDELPQEVMKISVRLLDDAHSAWLAADGECDRALGIWLSCRTWPQSHCDGVAQGLFSAIAPGAGLARVLWPGAPDQS